MTPARRGRRSETLAARYLKSAGYRILERNCRTKIGEIDILAEAPDRTIVVVEVKAGRQGSVRPEVHVGYHKQAKLANLGRELLLRPEFQARLIRFDVIAVEWPKQGKPLLRHHPAAFDARYG